MTPHAAVIGGGISGLASAWHMAKLGFDVTVLESSDALGGLAGTFPWRDTHLERFYHCILPSDRALLRLIHDLGMEGDLLWRESGMGFIHRRRLYPLNTPLDLLRFSPLRFMDRLRMGLLGIRAGAKGNDPQLDDVAVGPWLREQVGERAFQTVWAPLLKAKIGDRHADLPALWLTSRMQREKSTRREIKGCLKGGYRPLTEALEAALRRKGVTIRLGVRAEAIEREGEQMAVRTDQGRQIYDLVVATCPLLQFQQLAQGLPLPATVADLALDYQGVVCGVFLLQKPLSRWYWLPIVDSGVHCQGIVEMSNLTPPERTHGLHLAYLVNYAHRNSDIYKRSNAETVHLYKNDLRVLFPEAARTIVDAWAFRTPFVEPIWPLGYRRRRPPTSVIPGRLYLACTAQVYPQVNSWNSCCEVVESMMPALAAETAGAARPTALAGAAR
ncbi:MAG TPA: FAD-dependent oxidoreductase [Candidatus Eisenbacteria bacterium]|nr:FAD-dependent oxidoreductase [Candidatus Eisenbacteria bacterium]